MKLILLPVEPTGVTHGLGQPGGIVEIPTYPESPWGEKLRETRVGITGHTLREAASLLGITVADWSALERGAKTLSQEQWDCVIAVLTQAPPVSAPASLGEEKTKFSGILAAAKAVQMATEPALAEDDGTCSECVHPLGKCTGHKP